MAFVRNVSNPANFYYLDQEGIHSLYAQCVARLEVERSTTIEKTIAGKAGIGAKLKNLLLKAIAGTDFEVNGEVSGSRKSLEQSKQVVRVENELAGLLKVLEHAGEPTFFTTLSAAARRVRQSSSKVFISVEDRFNAPQFRADSSGGSVITDGFLALEIGVGDDYDYRDDYYKNIQIPVVLRAGVDKMPTGCFERSSHLATYIKGHRGSHFPLRVFGAMMHTPAYFQIKPYAIWL